MFESLDGLNWTEARKTFLDVVREHFVIDNEDTVRCARCNTAAQTGDLLLNVHDDEGHPTNNIPVTIPFPCCVVCNDSAKEVVCIKDTHALFLMTFQEAHGHNFVSLCNLGLPTRAAA